AAWRTVEPRDADDAVRLVAEAAAEDGSEVIVVGLPYALPGGEEGEIAQQTRAFAALLAERTGLEVRTEDERLTSVLADRMKRDYGSGSKKFDRDAVAAAVMLETHIETRKREDDGKG
ncbi:Holliday junction resolvase RuvX, partial [Patescibacteria group bacterium]